MKERKKILTMLVENNYGVTSRVSGMFSRRGFNLDSFTGCDTLDSRFSRITVVVHGDEQVLEQIEKQVRKLEDVIYVTDLTAVDSVCRELMLVKVRVLQEKLDAFINLLDGYEILEVASTGLTGLERGSECVVPLKAKSF